MAYYVSALLEPYFLNPSRRVKNAGYLGRIESSFFQADYSLNFAAVPFKIRQRAKKNDDMGQRIFM